MAKEFLIRYGNDADFQQKRLALREFGFAIDVEKLYIGGRDGNLYIPTSAVITEMIKSQVDGYKMMAGTTQLLNDTQVVGTLAYDTDTKRIRYKASENVVKSILTLSDALLSSPTTVQVEAGNIDTNDDNSVTLSDFNRPTKMVFLNGVLCTSHVADPHKYTYDDVQKKMKIKNCTEGDLISYF